MTIIVARAGTKDETTQRPLRIYACILLGFTRARREVSFANVEASHGPAEFRVHWYNEEEEPKASHV